MFIKIGGSSLIITVILAVTTCTFSEKAEVTTPKGGLRGTTGLSRSGKDYFSFRGVRYAQPPNRFEESKPVVKWEGVKVADSLGESCPQQFGTPAPIGSEDCLFLNVYTTKLNKDAGLNVMVWIHGGGFQFGSSSEFEPDYFMDHDVVLVTINYRLGILGFLSSGDETLPGNLGLKDQRLALQWVRDNIRAFGGSEDKVTIFGESAGAAAVNFHVLSKSTQGLFNSAIAQSGSALNPWALQRKPKDNFRTLLRKAGCPVDQSATKGLECLRKLEMTKVLELQNSFMEWFLFPVATFAPVIEPRSPSAMLTDTPLNSMKKGSFNKVPYMTGVTVNEGLFFTAGLIFNKEFVKDMESDPTRVFPTGLMYQEVNNVTKALIDFYMGSDHSGFSPERWAGLEKWFGDRWINHGVMEATKLLSQHIPVYTYIFSYQGEASALKPFWGVNDIYGVAHADELQYLFKSWSGLPPISEGDGASAKVSKEIVKSFVNFGRNGKPSTWGKAKDWEPAKGKGLWKWYNIGSDTSVEDVNETMLPRLKFWKSVYPNEDMTKGRDKVQDEL